MIAVAIVALGAFFFGRQLEATDEIEEYVDTPQTEVVSEETASDEIASEEMACTYRHCSPPLVEAEKTREGL